MLEIFIVKNKVDMNILSNTIKIIHIVNIIFACG